jgi:hypothetical protein
VNSSSERRSLIIACVAGVVVLAVAGVSLAGLKRVDRREHCLWNLSRIGMVIIAAEPRKTAEWDRIGTGRLFFRDFEQWPGPPPFPFDPRWFCCPEVGKAVPGRIDYRGPAASIRELDKDEPVVADKPGNHGAGEGGNIVFRNGSSRSVPEADPAWARAAATTSDRENPIKP